MVLDLYGNEGCQWLWELLFFATSSADFFLSSSSSLSSFADFFQCLKQPIYFCEYHEGGIQAASSYTAQKEKTKKEWLRGFRVFCSAFLSVEGDMGKEKWRIYTNTKSFSPPSAERAMACANRMRGKKRVQSKQTQSSQPKVK